MPGTLSTNETVVMVTRAGRGRNKPVKTILWSSALALSLVASGTASATLISRRGGQAYYDDVLDVT